MKGISLVLVAVTVLTAVMLFPQRSSAAKSTPESFCERFRQFCYVSPNYGDRAKALRKMAEDCEKHLQPKGLAFINDEMNCTALAQTCKKGISTEDLKAQCKSVVVSQPTVDVKIEPVEIKVTDSEK